MNTQKLGNGNNWAQEEDLCVCVYTSISTLHTILQLNTIYNITYIVCLFYTEYGCGSTCGREHLHKSHRPLCA